MGLVVLVLVVPGLSQLELGVHGLTGLLAHDGQPAAQPVQERLEVAAHHVELPGNGVLDLEGG